jgi:hypothetical protein
MRTKIRLIESHTKCRNLTKLTFAAGVLSVRGPSHVYTVYLFTQERGEGGGELTKEKVIGAMVHKAGSKIPT